MALDNAAIKSNFKIFKLLNHSSYIYLDDSVILYFCIKFISILY
jgi:hypothetical protein